jgi:hypothetical protein
VGNQKIAMKKIPSPKTVFLLFIFFLIFAIPTSDIQANSAPPSLMEFHLIFNVEESSIIKGILLACEDEKCEKSTEYEAGFNCFFFNKYESCLAGLDEYDYDYDRIKQFIEDYPPGFHKLVIEFSDKTRESNVFYHTQGSEVFKVYVNDNSLLVKKDRYFNYFSPYGVIALLFTAIFSLIIEGIISAIYLKLSNKNLKFVLYVLIANIISYPIVWFGFLPLIDNTTLYRIVAEVGAVVIETVLLSLFGKKYNISFRNALVLSIITNLSSYLFWELIVSLFK